MNDLGDDICWIGAADTCVRGGFGSRADWLARAAALGAPVPPAVAIRGRALSAASQPRGAGELADALTAIVASNAPKGIASPTIFAVRPSAHGTGAIAPAVLPIGVDETSLSTLEAQHGARAAADLERRFVQGYAANVLGLAADEFEFALYDTLKDVGAAADTELDAAQIMALTERFRSFIGEEGTAIPADPAEQLADAIHAVSRAWSSPRAARKLRARGMDAPEQPAIILQVMAIGLGEHPSGAGIAALRSDATGAVGPSGRYLPNAQGEDVLMGLRTPALLSRLEAAAHGSTAPSLEDAAPEAYMSLRGLMERLEAGLGEAFDLAFALEAGKVKLLDLRPMQRSSRAALRIAVELAEAKHITRTDALARIHPARLDDHLHPTLLPGVHAETIGNGLAASPGAASGPLVFSPDAAEAAAAAGEPAILALIETGPEDIRGMHAAAGVITVRGGMTSHAALVARGLGRPCVVGARDLTLDRASERLTARGGQAFGAGAAVTVDGGTGRVLAGRVATQPPEITGAFATLMGWADGLRRLGVRANADTAQDAATARSFNAGGIGLCRTEHMFFQRGRIAAMQEMILAETPDVRRSALARLAPMQRADFVDLFREMAGLPVVIRLLDPPLHEFLPHGRDEMAELADALGVPVAKVAARALELKEFNPMLGKRGCRIGIAYPEIYEMQAEAIFAAALEAEDLAGQPVRPEIMIPLISAVRELEVLRSRIDAVAERIAPDGRLGYTVGVMVETPRACLRAGDIARIADFLSFGTNDLTQMLYGLSRDDAGRFMPDYVGQGVFAHDPFHRIDEEGVGEIIRIAIDRARKARPDISIGLCGEHGGDPASIAFCELAGFDYVSCSPYRVPVARLAAAQASESRVPEARS